jgi:RNA polymerase sigma-70 factor (sigma-E family)
LSREREERHVVDGFDEYVLARGPGLLRFGYLLAGDRHLAEDLVQEALAHCHRKWPRIERLDQPDAYVRKAVLREYLTWRRRRSSTERAVASMPDRAAPADHADQLADRDELWLLLGALSRMQRAVLVLRFFEDASDERIADLLNCSAATVRVHASRGLARLRDAVDQLSTEAQK